MDNFSSRDAEAQPNARWFKEEVKVHEADLRAYLRSRFSSLPDLDDIIQDTYARLLKLRQGGPLAITRAYLFVTARNVALDLIRRRKVIAFHPLDQTEASFVVEETAHAADQLCHAEELQLLGAAIADLPPRCRDIMLLCHHQHFSYREIGRQLGISESTVHAQLCLGLKRCREYLAAHGVKKGDTHG